MSAQSIDSLGAGLNESCGHCQNAYDPTDSIMEMRPKAGACRKHPSDSERLNEVPARNMRDLIVKRVIK